MSSVMRMSGRRHGASWTVWLARSLCALGVWSCSAMAAHAAPVLEVRPVAEGLARPIGLVHAGDGSQRLFIVQQGGQILIHGAAGVLARPFLDIAALVSCCGERGLLGLAFHPQYASNGRFFVNYTDRAGNTVVAGYTVSADPDVADPASGQILLTIAQPFANHNGGQLQFGPDGYLYIGTGDGGSAGDPGNRAQDPASLLGKMLRIDVDGGAPYAIPPDNPFVGVTGARPEIWALGLRNPWRFSFDRVSGDLFVADVGQNTWEEINFQPASSAGGENYGWRLMEGAHCFLPASGCDDGSLVLPIIEYSHDLGCSVTGGYRYRGSAVAGLDGTYLYADFCTGVIRGAGATPAGSWQSEVLLETGFRITSFGEDEAGELYVVRSGVADGAVYRLELAPPAAASDLNGDRRSDIVLRHRDSGHLYLLAMNGAAFSSASIGGLHPVWEVAGRGDFGGDGMVDLLLRHTGTGQLYLFEMNGSVVTRSNIGALGLVWQVVAVDDFGGDRKADILLRHAESGRLYLFEMDGNRITGSSIGPLNPIWQVAGTGDVGGDGKADILLRRSDSGQLFLFEMDGSAVTRSNIGALDPVWAVAGIGDFGGDARADILLRHTGTGRLHLFEMNGNLVTGSGIVGLPLVWQVAQIGDFGGDGRADILLRNSSTGQLFLFEMNGSQLTRSNVGALNPVWVVQ